MSIIIDASSEATAKEKDKFYCVTCKFPLASNDDFKCNRDYKCCYECFLKFVESRKKEWKDGWRPKQNLIDSYIENRKDIYKSAGE